MPLVQPNDPRHLLVEITKILDRLRIPYLVSGGMAVLMWGRPRFTADIDIVIELQTNQLEALAKNLQSITKDAYVPADVIKQALAQKGEFNFIDPRLGLKVDFWIFQDTPFDRSRFERRITKKILSRGVSFSSAEDLILVKLEWYQQSRSTRHLEDIESIIAISGKKLDKKYLKTCSKRQGTFEILEKYL